MPLLKGLTSNFKRTKSSSNTNSPDPSQQPQDDSPESTMIRAARAFCETDPASAQGEEVLHLPVIVDSAESSPAAASAACYNIRKFLSKEYYDKPNVQYNAVMLFRILCENPGQSFTKNIDSKFINTVSSLVKGKRDPNVQQILRETLDALEMERYQDPGLTKLLESWRLNRGFRINHSYQQQHQQQTAVTRSMDPRYNHNGAASQSRLPTQTELASRVEESKNSAKILLQLVQSTPQEEILGNDLVKEFAERCQAAQRSMQGFINAENPSPDDDTLQTLIETSEQLSMSLSRHQRAMLGARRTLGLSASATGSPDPAEQRNGNGRVSPPLVYNSPPPPPPPQQVQGIPSLAPEPRQSEHVYAPPPHPPRKDAPSSQIDPFADGTAERSNYQHSGSNSTGRQEYASQQQQPVTYRY